MKKNISINISGIIFHIEEDGYDILRKYLDSINAYFSSYEDNSEILADIESRIAEIFLSKLNEGKQVITKDDVDSLMSTMGSVKDFKEAEEQDGVSVETVRSSGKEESGESSQRASSRKLYRDQKRKIFGGVCAGLGHYFNIDPVWPRLLFALLAFGSYGGIILAYIILWILLPESQDLEEADVKKMFRDPEKKVIGGVASGVAAFFGTDLTLVRILFIVFTFVGGLGLLIYIILWIALPEAKSLTEKMQMQGEPVTLSNIESTVKKSLNEKDSEEESLAAKIILFPFRLIAMIINGLAKILGPVFSMGVEILRVGFGLLITVIGIVLMFAFFLIGGIVLGLWSLDTATMLPWTAHLEGVDLPMEAIKNAFPLCVTLAALTIAIIPALFITLLGVSTIVKRIIFKPILGWSLFVLFFLCIAVLSFKIPQTIFSFREEGTYKEEQVYPTDGKTLVFNMRKTGLDDYDMTSIRLIGYDGEGLRVVKRFEAQGSTREIAEDNAQMVTYSITKADSIYTFDSNLMFKKDAAFRAQRIKVDLYIPYNQTFVADEDLWKIIDNYGRYYYRNDGDRNVWKMTTSGLECVSCENRTGMRSSTNRDLKDFNTIELTGLFNTYIEQGEEFSVEVNGEPEQMSRYEVYTQNETLVIDYDDHGSFWNNNPLDDERIRINITMPNLRELEVKGAGKLRFRDFDESDMQISLSGAVVADGEIDCTTLDVNLTGASFLDLEGVGVFMEAKINGASGLRAFSYEVERAVIEAHGASSAKVNVSEVLETNDGFASNISNRGDAKRTKIR